jgi:hypothetical protein
VATIYCRNVFEKGKKVIKKKVEIFYVFFLMILRDLRLVSWLVLCMSCRYGAVTARYSVI